MSRPPVTRYRATFRIFLLKGRGSGLPPQGLVAPVRGPPAGGTGTGVKGRTIDERTHSP